jgi:heme-degrading monooxygenase HmoA
LNWSLYVIVGCWETLRLSNEEWENGNKKKETKKQTNKQRNKEWANGIEQRDVLLDPGYKSLSL